MLDWCSEIKSQPCCTSSRHQMSEDIHKRSVLINFVCGGHIMLYTVIFSAKKVHSFLNA